MCIPLRNRNMESKFLHFFFLVCVSVNSIAWLPEFSNTVNVMLMLMWNESMLPINNMYNMFNISNNCRLYIDGKVFICALATTREKNCSSSRDNGCKLNGHVGTHLQKRAVGILLLVNKSVVSWSIISYYPWGDVGLYMKPFPFIEQHRKTHLEL